MGKRIKYLTLLILIISLAIFASGCDNVSDTADIVYNFAGSVGKGDFINIKVNMTNEYLEYEVKPLYDVTKVEKGTYYFRDNGGDFYTMNQENDHFFMINNEILIATNSGGLDGEKIITALPEINSEYGTEIQNTYNIITSLEGNWGTVEFKSDTVDIKLTEDGINYELLSGIPYNYNSNYGAVEIIENESKFRHYGVFLNGEVGVFDSYWRDTISSDWSGDGMSVLVKQNKNIILSDFIGEYKFIDVDGDIGTINISEPNDTSINLAITVSDGTASDEINKNDIIEESGLFTFEADLTGGGNGWWSMMLVPDKNKKILILGTKDPNVLAAGNDSDEDGGIFIAIEQ